MINRYVALDIETTGLNPAVDRIIEFSIDHRNKIKERDVARDNIPLFVFKYNPNPD